MKKILAMILAFLMAFTAYAALAEEEGKLAPMFATVGDALDTPGEHPVGGNEDYFSVITEQDGTYYRHVAYMDETAKKLRNAISTIDIDEMEAAFAASDKYNATLPIAYSEAFTVYPMSREEMDALVGRTIGELTAAGFESVGTTGSDEYDFIYMMRKMLFDYEMAVDVDEDAFLEAAQSGDSGNAGSDFVVTAVKLFGISNEAASLDVHTDGTVEEAPDPFADMAAVTAALTEKIQAIANGEEVDLDTFVAELKEQYPDMAEMIEGTLDLYKLFGAESFLNMMNSATEDTAAPEE